MTSLKRTFYMVLGFTFPFFWAYHAGGFADFLYKPIQFITSTKSNIWPSCITTFLLYSGLIILIEMITRPRKGSYTPEWPDLSQVKQTKRKSISNQHSEGTVNQHPTQSPPPSDDNK